MASPDVAALNAQLGIIDPQADVSGKIIGATIAALIIAVMAIALRLFCRWLCRKRLELNDYLILAAFAFKLAINTSSILLISAGIGTHVTTLTPAMITRYLKTLYIGSFVYAPCIGFAKLSVLALYWSAFPTARYMKAAVVTTGACVFAWAFACCLVGLMACLPIHAFWTPELQPSARCINNNAYYYGLQVPNILTDIVILAIPWKAVYDLSKSQGLQKRQTLALFGIFNLGIVTIIFDIVRLVVLIRTPTTPDFSWNQVRASIWTDIEPSIAILVACLPVMRPLLNLQAFLQRRHELAATRLKSIDLEDIGTGHHSGEAGAGAGHGAGHGNNTTSGASLLANASAPNSASGGNGVDNNGDRNGHTNGRI